MRQKKSSGIRPCRDTRFRKTAGIAAALSAALLISLPGARTVCQAAEEYTYTVRIYAGAQGTIDGQEVKVIEGLTPDDRISFQPGDVTLKENSKYYVKGIRLRGTDSGAAVQRASFPVTEDADYIVAYGVLGDAVQYTVSYVDEAGNNLAQPETFYGNVGDRPVAAFRYFEGYQPQAYNLTGILKENSAENQFTFRYNRVRTQTNVATNTVPGAAVTTVVSGTKQTTAATGTTATKGTAGTAGAVSTTGITGTDATEDAFGANAGNAGEDDASGVHEGEGPDTTSDAGTVAAQPAEIVDIDDGEVPPSSFDESSVTEEEAATVTEEKAAAGTEHIKLQEKKFGTGAKAAIVVVIAAVAAACVCRAAVKRRKR